MKKFYHFYEKFYHFDEKKSTASGRKTFVFNQSLVINKINTVNLVIWFAEKKKILCDI